MSRNESRKGFERFTGVQFNSVVMNHIEREEGAESLRLKMDSQENRDGTCWVSRFVAEHMKESLSDRCFPSPVRKRLPRMGEPVAHRITELRE